MASITKRPDGRWRARYRDANGKEHAKHFDRKIDGQRWLGQTTAALVTGQYVDPRAGRITFAEYYDTWASRQVWESTTGQAMSLAARSATFAEPRPDQPKTDLRRTYRGLRAQNRRKVTNDLHAEVARVYTAGRSGGAPVQAVAEHFGIAVVDRLPLCQARPRRRRSAALVIASSIKRRDGKRWLEKGAHRGAR